MWIFASVAVAVLLLFSFLYELGSDAQAKQNIKEEERLKKIAEECDARKQHNDAEDKRIAAERIKLANEAKRIKESKQHLTVNQLCFGSFVFIVIAIAIILFFKSISSN